MRRAARAGALAIATVGGLAGALPAQAARVADRSTVGGNVRHAIGVRTTAWTTPHALRRRWRTHVDGVIGGAPIILGREKLAVVTTSHGFIVALRLANGHVRWRFHAGQRADQCPAIADPNGLGHVGVTGGAVLDPKSRVVYAVDALGYLHALRAADGHELRGWPIKVIANPAQELAWSQPTVAMGRVFVTTGGICDRPPYTGRLYAVDVATRRITSFAPYDTPPGAGGGGIWGPAAVTVDGGTGELWVATGNALGNDEGAGLGERIVRLSPSLQVLDSVGPVLDVAGSVGHADLDFGATPTLFRPRGCQALVAAPNKDGRLYVYRRAGLVRPAFAVLAQRPAAVVFGMAVWDPASQRLVLESLSSLNAYRVLPGCRGMRLAWKAPLASIAPAVVVNGYVLTVASRGGRWAVALRRARDGRLMAAAPAPPSVVQPAVSGRLVVSGGYEGGVTAWDVR